MTLRELLTVVIDTGGLHRVAKIIQEKYYSEHTSDQAICDRITDVILELVSLEGDQTLKQDNSIRLTEYTTIVADGPDEQTIHVGLFEHSTESKFALDLIPWNQLIDLTVKNETPTDLHETVAHIVWEVTFWGTTAQEIDKQIELMQQSRDELEQADGELVGQLIEWDDIQQEFTKNER